MPYIHAAFPISTSNSNFKSIPISISVPTVKFDAISNLNFNSNCQIRCNLQSQFQIISTVKFDAISTLKFQFQFNPILIWSNLNFNAIQHQFEAISISIQFKFEAISISISNSTSNVNPMSMSMSMSISIFNSIPIQSQCQFQISNPMSMSMFLINLNSQSLFQCQLPIQIHANPLSIYSWANKNGHVYFQIKSMTIYPQLVSC